MAFSYIQNGCKFLSLLLVIATTSLACTQQAPPPTQQEIHLKALAVCYGKFLASHQGRTPKNEAEFKAFVEQLPREQIPGAPSDSSSLFVSPRDNQPYLIRYDIGPAMPGLHAPVIAYEQTGVDGKRYVANLLGAVEQVDEATFREHVPNASGTPVAP